MPKPTAKPDDLVEEPAPPVVLDTGTASPAYRHPTNVRGWYAPARHLQNLFVPLAVLQTLSQLADGDGKVSYAEACHEVGPAMLTAMMQMLKLLGYISTDGVTITIVKLPVPMESHQ